MSYAYMSVLTRFRRYQRENNKLWQNNGKQNQSLSVHTKIMGLRVRFRVQQYL